MKKKIFAFYRAILDVDQAGEFAQANIWKQSWEAQGWEAVMLNASHITQSPFTNILMSRIMGLRQFNAGIPAVALDRMMARAGRWTALDSGGGGWISDYDVVNLGFTPEMAEKIEKEVDIAVPKGEAAWVIYANREAAHNAARDLANGAIFMPPDWKRFYPEYDLLKIKNDVFKDVPLVHVTNTKEGEKKHEVMAQLLYDYRNPPAVATVPQQKPKKSNRKTK
jgi:hypothetical protein